VAVAAAAAGACRPRAAGAVLVLLHLLAAGVRVVAKQLSDLTCDPLGLVVGELAAQIRSFPSTRTRRGLAGTLLMDTKAALLRELRPHRTRAHRDVYEVPIDPTDPTTARRNRRSAAPTRSTSSGAGGRHLSVIDGTGTGTGTRTVTVTVVPA